MFAKRTSRTADSPPPLPPGWSDELLSAFFKGFQFNEYRGGTTQDVYFRLSGVAQAINNETVQTNLYGWADVAHHTFVLPARIRVRGWEESPRHHEQPLGNLMLNTRLPLGSTPGIAYFDTRLRLPEGMLAGVLQAVALGATTGRPPRLAVRVRAERPSDEQQYVLAHKYSSELPLIRVWCDVACTFSHDFDTHPLFTRDLDGGYAV